MPRKTALVDDAKKETKSINNTISLEASRREPGSALDTLEDFGANISFLADGARAGARTGMPAVALTAEQQRLVLTLFERVAGREYGSHCLEYRKNDSMRLKYISRGFAEQLGYSLEEISTSLHNEYTRLIHPADLKSYRSFVDEIAARQGSGSLEYRMQRKDGSIMHVHDKMRAVVVRRTSRAEGEGEGKGEDATEGRGGVSEGSSQESLGSLTIILSLSRDITKRQSSIESLDAENRMFRDLMDGVPFGIARTSMGDGLKLTYTNNVLMQMVGIDGSPHNSRDLYLGDDVSMFLPADVLDRVDAFAERVRESSDPVPFDVDLLARNRDLVHVAGWAIGMRSKDGGESIVYCVFDETPARKEELQARIRACVDTMGTSFDCIVMLDANNGVARNLSGSLLQWSETLPFESLPMPELVNAWIESEVVPAERDLAYTFLSPALSNGSPLRSKSSQSERLTLDATPREDGEPRRIEITLPRLGEGIYLLCYRDITDIEAASTLRMKNRLCEYGIERFVEFIGLMSSGFASFSLDAEGNVYIDNATGEACRYLGIPEMPIATPGRLERSYSDFVDKSLLTKREWESLLDAGWITLTPFEGDVIRGGVLLKCYSCPETGIDPHGGQVIKPRIEAGGEPARYYLTVHDAPIDKGSKSAGESREAEGEEAHHVFVRTFGHFELFVDGTPVPFGHAKSKELLALLIDRRGGYISSREAISFLWEDEPADKTTLARYRKVAMRLKNTLDEQGVGYILENSQRNRRIDTHALHCDLYDYLWGGPKYADTFHGFYLVDYSWSERTLAELLSKKDPFFGIAP